MFSSEPRGDPGHQAWLREHRVPVFPKVGSPPRPSGVPGELDRGDRLLNWSGGLETAFSAPNSLGPHKSLTGAGHGLLPTEVQESDS